MYVEQYRKEAINQTTNRYKSLSKEINNDNFFYRKIGKAITK